MHHQPLVPSRKVVIEPSAAKLWMAAFAETAAGAALSALAISYYLLGLLGYAAKGLEGLGLAFDPGPLAALGVAVVVPVVWGGVRHLRQAAAPPSPGKPGPRAAFPRPAATYNSTTRRAP